MQWVPNMAKQIQVISVGPDIRVQGGISRVIELISARVPGHVSFRHVPTFTQFTGGEGLDPSQRGSRFGQSLVYMCACAKILKKAIGHRAVFHVHFAGRGSVIRKGLICGVLRILGCTYAVHSHAAHTNLFHSWVPQLGRRLLLWGIAGADRMIVLTEFWRDHYASSLGLLSKQLLVLPNPADLPDTIPERLHDGALKLLFLGRVGERKGAFDLIHAFAQLPDDVRCNCSLTLAGDGEVGVAASLAAQSGCSERVAIRGWVGPKEVETLLRDSDVLLLPSHAEGMSMALIEAMSWALAVITTNTGGAQAFLEHGQNSILVAPGDVEGIGRAICELYRNPPMRVALGVAARETISHFSIESYMTKLTSLYEEMSVSQTGKPGNAATSHDYAKASMGHPAKPAAVKLDRTRHPKRGEYAIKRAAL